MTYCCLPVSLKKSGVVSSDVRKTFLPRDVTLTGYFLFFWPFSVNPRDHFNHLPHSYVQFELQQALMNMSACLHALNCCHMIGWLGIFFNVQLSVCVAFLCVNAPILPKQEWSLLVLFLFFYLICTCWQWVKSFNGRILFWSKPPRRSPESCKMLSLFLHVFIHCFR